MIELSDLTEIFDTREEHVWNDLRSESEEENVLNLISEAENCHISDSKRACVVMLWSASIEKLKWMLLMFSKNQLRLANGLKDREYHAPEDFDGIVDSDLIEAAEDLELLDSDEALHLQAIRSYIRNKCAHGDEIDLEEDTIILIEHMARDYIFNKSDSAGITVTRVMKIIEQKQFPEKMLEDVEYFSQNKQSKLANKLYDLRRDLPLKRINARENYQTNTDVWSRSDLDRRDLISDCISVIWPNISDDVKELVKNRAKQDSLDNEGARGFILESGNDIMSETEFNEFLKNKLLPNYSHQSKEDVNDIIMSLWLCRDRSFKPDTELAELIWPYGIAECYSKENTRQKFKEFVEELNEDLEEIILTKIEDQVKKKERRWDQDSIQLMRDETILRSSGIAYLTQYYESHSPENKEKVIQIMEGSKFSRLDEVKEFLKTKNQHENNK